MSSKNNPGTYQLTRLWGILAALIALGVAGQVGPAAAQEDAEPIAQILYASHNTVYLDKGEADGLTIDTELDVRRAGRVIGKIRIIYLAQHSASCEIVGILEDEQFEVGDQASFVPAPQPPPETIFVKREAAEEFREPIKLEPRETKFEVHGRAALEWQYFGDNGSTSETFHQPSVYLSISGKRPRTGPFAFHLRMRTKYNQRNRAFGTEVPETEWTHRVYRASLSYADPARSVSIHLGRLFSADLPGAGNWDGALFEYRVDRFWRFGVLGGGEPGLSNSEPDFSRQKYGAFLSVNGPGHAGRRSQGTVALVGQYRSGRISREFGTFGCALLFGPKLSLRQDLEVDIKRNWRRLPGEQRLALARLNTLVQYHPHTRLGIDLSYDHFQNVRRDENRDIPDSLFADAMQQGLRLGLRYKLSRSIRCGARAGYRVREDEDKQPFFGNADLRLSNVCGSGCSLLLRYSYADGRFVRSHAPTVDLRRRFGRRLHLGAGYGTRSFTGIETESADQEGQWFRFTGTYRASRRVDLQWLWTTTAGDIGAGTRAMLRFGYRW